MSAATDTTAPTPPTDPPINGDDRIVLEARGISKRYPGVVALDGVGLRLRAGEVHALMGENGAGKSTLIRCLAGVHPPDAGVISLGGRPVRPLSPRHAESLGLSVVHQEVHLIPHRSVADNIMLGREPTRLGLIRRRAVRARARAALGRVGLDLDERRPVASFPIAVRQLVAIARALDIDARVLILDEPTSSLDAAEAARLYDTVDRLRRRGLAILLVTHNLGEVYAVADRVTVLRDGRGAGEFLISDLPRGELVRRMLGRDNPHASPPPSDPVAPARTASEQPGAGALAASGLGRRGVGPIDLSVRRGEVVGMAGLLGSGRTEALRLIFGLDRADRGRLELGGRPASPRGPRDAIRRGVAFTPEDRRAEGVLPRLSVLDNITLALQAWRGWRRISRRDRRRIASRLSASLRLKARSPEAPAGTLSGGNQQKMILARWLALDPALLLLDEPTRGIDAGAKTEVLAEARSLARGGAGVVVACSELPELVAAADRVVVMRDRRTCGEFDPAAGEAPIVAAMAGHGA